MLVDIGKIPKGWHLKRLGSKRAKPTGKNLPSRHLLWECVLSHDRESYSDVKCEGDSIQYSVNSAIKTIIDGKLM